MRSTGSLLLSVVLGFSFAFASCGPTQRACGPSTCSGCCDANGECLAGNAVFDCGAGGVMCMACQPNEVCRTGACERFENGDYDASFPGGRDASVNLDAGTFDGGGPRDSGTVVPDAGVRPTDGGVSFQADLVPIFIRYCVSCHANRATHADVRARVVPGDPPGSLLYQKITGTQTRGAPMPLGGQLSNDDPPATMLIERWIRQGAANN